MDDDALAQAWESFATALQDVPARRLERSLCRPTRLADFGVNPMHVEAMRYQAMAMRAASPQTYGGNTGFLGLRLF